MLEAGLDGASWGCSAEMGNGVGLVSGLQELVSRGSLKWSRDVMQEQSKGRDGSDGRKCPHHHVVCELGGV